MVKLDKHFKCPKWLKIATAGQTRSERRSLFEAFQEYLNFKKKAIKTKEKVV